MINWIMEILINSSPKIFNMRVKIQSQSQISYLHLRKKSSYTNYKNFQEEKRQYEYMVEMGKRRELILTEENILMIKIAQIKAFNLIVIRTMPVNVKNDSYIIIRN